MHEYSLVRSLLDQVVRIRQEHHAEAVDSIRVEVGPLSGVEPLLFEAAFQQLATQTLGSDVVLAMDEVALQALCKLCHQTFEIHEFVFRCPFCGSIEVQVVRGDCLQLVSVSLRGYQSPLELAK